MIALILAGLLTVSIYFNIFFIALERKQDKIIRDLSQEVDEKTKSYRKTDELKQEINQLTIKINNIEKELIDKKLKNLERNEIVMDKVIEVSICENYDYNDEWDGWTIVLINKMNDEIIDFYGFRDAYELFTLLNWFRVLDPSIKINCTDKYPEHFDYFKFDNLIYDD